VKIFFAAINHFDPLCRSRLLYWLRQKAQQNAEPPDFVGVEWEQGLFEYVKSQRTELRRMAEETWPSAQPAFIDALVQALAFEGDTHLEVFTGVQTVWLDQGRVLSDPTIISHYARDRIKIYQSYLPDVSAYDERTLLHMSREAWRRCASGGSGATCQDEKFTSIITRYLKEDSGSWAPVIVGADHASQEPGCLMSRLKSAGIDCIVSDLRPKPAAG
jgi:hypothetical protein